MGLERHSGDKTALRSRLRLGRRSFLMAGCGFAPIVRPVWAASKRVLLGEYSDFDPNPTGKVRVSKPVVAWRVVGGDGMRVTGAKLAINNTPVEASYNGEKQAVWFAPRSAFAPGVYKVSCAVQFNDAVWVDKAWQFVIGGQAVESPAPPTEAQKEAIEMVNLLRARVGLGPVVLDERLCAAAQGHCVYVARHGGHVTHEQTDTQSADFLARDASGRAGAWGFAGGCFEAVGQGAIEGRGVIGRLFDAPYHRAPFVQTGTLLVGAGVVGDIATLVFSDGQATGLQTVPANNQNNVPLGWDGIETPNPLRSHGETVGTGLIGYPITLHIWGDDGGDFRLEGVSATLTEAGGANVPLYVNHAQNDDALTSGVILLPRRPLRPGTMYKAVVHARDDGNGKRLRHEWTFTTTKRALTPRDLPRPGDPPQAEFAPLALVPRAKMRRITLEEGFR